MSDESSNDAANLFSILGSGEEASLLNVVIIGAVNVVATLLAMLLADRLGRRFLLLAGSIQMIVSFIVVAGMMGATFNITTGYTPTWSARAIIAFECLFTSAFAWSWGPLGWLVCTSLFMLLLYSFRTPWWLSAAVCRLCC